MNIYELIQRNLNESVGDFTNTSLSQPAMIINKVTKEKDSALGEAVESELKLSGKVSEILNQTRNNNYTGLEKLLNVLNPNADVTVMYNTDNKFLHIEVPNLGVLWDGKEPQ